MESGSVPVETRINAIVDYEVKKLSKKAIARKYGVSESTVRGWMHTRDYFVNKCLEIAKINEEGKLQKQFAIYFCTFYTFLQAI